MKIFIIAFFLTFMKNEVFSEKIDWTSVKPLWAIREWRDSHPNPEKLPQITSETKFIPRNPRIINGEITGPTEFPYMTGVLLHFDTGNSFCGGSLISRRFVLTAAKCVHIVPSSSVLLGASNMWGNVEQNIRVSQIRIHPLFSLADSLNDIATLELSIEAALSATINIVRLPNRRQVQTTFENQQGLILG